MNLRGTPERARIHAALAARNRRLRPLFVVWPVLTVVALLATNWGALAQRLPYAAIAVLVSGWPLYVGGFQATFRKVRWLEELSPDRRIGRYSRGDLLALIEDVHRRLGVRTDTPTAITADKDLNASVMFLGLAGVFPKLNAVYVHRPMLHVLAPGELAAVIGHELGHYHRYKVEFRWATPRHLLLLGAVAVLAVSHLGPSMFAIGAAAAFAWAHNTFLAAMDAPHQRDIEFLCDEAGAEAAGMLPAINCELKLGLQAETELHLQQDLLRAGKDIPVARLLALYEEALPFARVDADEVKRRLDIALRNEKKARRGLSLGGFIDHIREGDGDGEARAQLGNLIPEGALLEWDRDTLRRNGQLDEAQIGALVGALERDPSGLLFRHPHEALDPRLFTHPSHSRRVLYLWRNRAAIAATSVDRPGLSRSGPPAPPPR
ncbi:MAG: hypothetical protein EXR71_17250 [Myxococcales bacterium]|nr:hypothetical protein [Myxococcales bacterium]